MADFSRVVVEKDHLGWRRDLKTVLRSWIKKQREYVEWCDGEDLPYWYNERANVGLLAGAAAWNEHVVLEEFTSPKGGKADRWTGRGDLFLGLKEHEVLIEAKLTWPEVNDSSAGLKGLTARLNKRLDSAEDDVLQTGKGRWNVKRLAVLFCMPRVLVAREYDGARARLLDALPALMESAVDVDFWAAYFPEEAKRLPVSKTKTRYPGVILAGRTVTGL